MTLWPETVAPVTVAAVPSTETAKAEASGPVGLRASL